MNKKTPEEIKAELIRINELEGMTDIGFFTSPTDNRELNYGISIVFPLSREVIKEILIENKPTHSYFHHYRTVNFYLDGYMLRLGNFLQKNGYKYVCVGASQSIPTKDSPHGYSGRFSHKKGATLSGLGYIGTNNLFLHKQWGPCVRLGTVLTDCPLVLENPTLVPNTTCLGCQACVTACPANAIRGEIYEVGMEDFKLLDARACSEYMKREYKMIGRGSVCGVCMATCAKRFFDWE